MHCVALAVAKLNPTDATDQLDEFHYERSIPANCQGSCTYAHIPMCNDGHGHGHDYVVDYLHIIAHQRSRPRRPDALNIRACKGLVPTYVLRSCGKPLSRHCTCDGHYYTRLTRVAITAPSKHPCMEDSTFRNVGLGTILHARFRAFGSSTVVLIVRC